MRGQRGEEKQTGSYLEKCFNRGKQNKMKETERGETEREAKYHGDGAIFQNLPHEKNIQDRIKGGSRIKKLVLGSRKEWNMTPDSKKEKV